MKNFDPYAALGISRDATPEEVDAAFRDKAKEHHPDKGGNAEDFHKVRSAHVALRDPKRREKYDRTGTFEEHEIDQSEAKAWSYIAQCLQAIVANLTFDPFKVDLVDYMRAKIREELAEIPKQLVMLRKALKRAERVRKRFKKKKRKPLDAEKIGPNMIEGILITQIRDINDGIAMMNDDKAKRERALELLQDYEYDFDAPPPAQHFSLDDLIKGGVLPDVGQLESEMRKRGMFRFNLFNNGND